MNYVTVKEFDKSVNDHMKVCGSSFKSLHEDGCISIGCLSCKGVTKMPYEALKDLDIDMVVYREILVDINGFEDILVDIINEEVLNGETPGLAGSLMEKMQ